MVMIKRRTTVLDTRTSDSSIIYGDGCNATVQSFEPVTSPGMTISPESITCNGKSFSFSDKNKSGLHFPSWANNVMYGLLALSWIAALMLTPNAWKATRSLQFEEQAQKIQYETTLQELEDAKQASQATKGQVSHLLHTRQVMQHESQMAMELNDSGEEPPEFTKHDLVNEWLNRRQEKLTRKIDDLTEYVTTESRTQAIEKYGPGPHRVEFSIKFDTQKVGTFIVELAPLDLMPHAVYSFLQQVSRGLWDNTVFWHKDGVDHVISGRAISSHTWDPKDHYFDALGMGALSFAEYSPEYPHKPWTIGFAGRGPNFYINVADNTAVHGPGGQGHHLLPDDADPCFGTIVEGMDTVREMYTLQLKQTRVARHKMDMRDEDVTHIMKAKILRSSK